MSATLVIRADGGATIGMGHISRCAALAEAWRKARIQVMAVTRSPELWPKEIPTLPLRTEQDGKETAALAKQFGAEWIVLDGYHFPVEMQNELKESGSMLLVFDDEARLERYDADLILNHNFGVKPQRYPHPERVLAGAKFAQIRREFLGRPVREIEGPAESVLVLMGGSDPSNCTALVLRALRATGLKPRVVIGPANARGEELQREFAGDAKFFPNPFNLPELMAEADLAITAGGGTTAELCCIGTPMAVVSIAENQRHGTGALAEAGLAWNLGPQEALTEEKIQEAVWALTDDVDARREMVRRQRAIYDGRGSFRVWLRMKELSMRLRPAGMGDAKIIWTWANDKETRAMSFDSEAIPWDPHVAWLESRLADERGAYWVGTDGSGRPFGQVRFEPLAEGAARVSVSVAPERRGQSIGTFLVWAGARKFFQEKGATSIEALIKKENGASLRLFEKAGFRPRGERRVKGQPAVRFVAEPEDLL
jgi:UDP-2,4-diacetamido-2,4,6-trideoxy-beta-L-altropyranose hydrolase